ncbi:MAG: 4,5-dihydroxyphthalate decarboxylase [Alphaproteobacteria bacterium MarineAlpha11_Bin1]|nr:MAG: 4,5-dihydroxyphthalate decarboxylase [Alphaproteobacteria bacterium MarineAlpha11_Bin1]|tara:strand:- start:20184 stop:21176 length:993 start_codon:yes stop_codon:yes gene_type:complete
MPRVPITICTGDYDRVSALVNGEIRVDGCDVNYLTMNPEQAFYRAWNNLEFDVTELSGSSYILARSAGWDDYIAVPVFPSRQFRHSSIYIRADAGIEKPEDLEGREVGVPVYAMTAALWIRGILQNNYGVSPADIHWRTGGLEEGGRKPKFQPNLPESIKVTPILGDQTLSNMLETGEITALISAREPSCFGRDNPNVVRLFSDFRAAEKAWYSKTGLFPIMHVLAIRKELAEREPWIATSILNAFTEAKDRCLEKMSDVTALTVSIPWVAAELRETQKLMGDDLWPYGFKENLEELKLMCRWSLAQGIAAREMEPEELFHPATMDRARI